MVERIVAFDIDGTLTKESVRSTFKELEQNDDVLVGIITSNPPLLANSFISKHNLRPDFQQSALIKARALLGIGMTYRPEMKTYVGNSKTDFIYSRLSNWEFIDSTDDLRLSDLSER